MNYYAVPASGAVYCSEHKPEDAVEVAAGACYISTLPYPGATVLNCCVCGVELWSAEKVQPWMREVRS